MTDLPSAGGADTTVGPVPGYYADPSIPGYVRYWGGTAWVPGTSRPTPAEGEVLEPPRFLGRPGRPVGARYVPPPSVGADPDRSDGGAPGAAGPGGPGGGGAGGNPGGVVLGPGDTGPVYFDQTSGGASFVMAPQAELELRRRTEVEARAAQARQQAGEQAGEQYRDPGQHRGQGPAGRGQGGDQLPAQAEPQPSGRSSFPSPAQAQWGGYPFTSTLPAHEAERASRTAGAVLRAAEPPVRGGGPAAAGPGSRPEGAPAPSAYAATVPAPQSSAPVPHQQGGGSDPDGPQSPGASGWQADPRAQRGLLETGGAPRWVSWGMLPGAAEAGVAPEPEAAPGPAPVAPRAPEAAAAEATAARAVPAAQTPSPAEPSAAEPALDPAPRADGTAATAKAAAVPRPAREVRAAVAAPDAAPVARAASAAAGAGRAAAPGRTPAAGARPAAASAGPARRSPAGRKPVARPAAGLGRRLVARVVDTTVMAIVAVAAGLPLASSATAHVHERLERARMASDLAGRQTQIWLVDGVVMGKAGVLLAVLLLAGLLYEVLPTARTGQTFGKRLAGIRVVDAGSAGRPSAPAPRRSRERAAAGQGTAAPRAQQGVLRTPTLRRSFLRWVVRELAWLLVIGFCWPLFDRRERRGWQDRAARTRVIRA